MRGKPCFVRLESQYALHDEQISMCCVFLPNCLMQESLYKWATISRGNNKSVKYITIRYVLNVIKKLLPCWWSCCGFIFIVARGLRTALTRLTDTRSWPLNEDWRILVNLESLYGTCEALTSVSFDITYNITTELSKFSQ